jgi:hypothetical protein
VADTKLAVIDRSKFLFLVQETPMFAASDGEYRQAPPRR